MTDVPYHIAAYHMGIELLKKAGFEFHHASMQTDTCYYTHPSRRPLLLRVSTHKSKKSPIGMNNVIARVTFSPKDLYLSEYRVTHMIKWAIGEYFLADQKQTRYDGKKHHEADATADARHGLRSERGADTAI